MEWAESPDLVFMNVKFAHKIDAPACVDIQDVKVDLQADRVYLTATCLEKTFELNFKPFGPILPDESTWRLLAAGRGAFQLKKKAPSDWVRLWGGSDKPKSKVYTYWSMKKKYEQEMDHYHTRKAEDRERDRREKKMNKMAEYQESIKDEDTKAKEKKEKQERDEEEARKLKEIKERKEREAKEKEDKEKAEEQALRAKRTREERNLILKRYKERRSQIKEQTKQDIARLEAANTNVKDRLDRVVQEQATYLNKHLLETLEASTALKNACLNATLDIEPFLEYLQTLEAGDVQHGQSNVDIFDPQDEL